MIRRPLLWRNNHTTAPTGHSTIAVATNATNPTVGPSTLHPQRLAVKHTSNGKGPCHLRVNHVAGLRHDSPPLAVAEQPHHRPHRPLHHRGHHERHKPYRGTQYLAPAAVRRVTLKA
ncbi:hypothetical protein RHGRI_023220 [Rhododendron griersonianum]|uniref:Uncharacterized protein n=1 Tax=Rhododendron griersonianum TaxID=479676 RepID=A0AAV6J4H2_9ERIC|nr:hypothetical protein RHGRI_023220 [Rhododendron griersonianum]